MQICVNSFSDQADLIALRFAKISKSANKTNFNMNYYGL